jgi:mannose-1-phosphate guanylyltransferase
MKRIAIIMAGGSGARLWPHSRESRPKQFLSLTQTLSLLQNTWHRLTGLFSEEHIFVITSENMIDKVEEQLPGIHRTNILAEPFGRNTAACMYTALHYLMHRLGDDVLCSFFPVDHAITNVREFQRTITKAMDSAGFIRGIVSIGVVPTRPEKSFGYIQAYDLDLNSEEPQVSSLGSLHRISTFAEKPDEESAKRFLASGDFLWNTGIYIARADVLRRAFHECLPELVYLYRQWEKALGTEAEQSLLEYMYRQIRSISFDYGVMEHIESGYVLEGHFDWSDVGSWDAAYYLAEKDAQNNAVAGNTIIINTQNCYVQSKTKLIALVDVEDLIVVEAEDCVMICRRGESQNVKSIVDLLRRKNLQQYM